MGTNSLAMLLILARFCRFSTPQEAQAAVDKMTGFKCGQKTLLCKLSNSSPGLQVSANLYIKPLSASTTEGTAASGLSLTVDDLKELFSPYGEILDCKVMSDKNTVNAKRVGFVRYSNTQDASNALKRMNGYQPPDSLPLVGKSLLQSSELT